VTLPTMFISRVLRETGLSRVEMRTDVNDS
jgi:hypothetical protein